MKADIFSFVIMLYYLMTNTYPLEEQTLQGLLQMAKTGYYHLPTSIELVYRNIIAMCLIVNPDKRASFIDIKEYLNKMNDESKLQINSTGHQLSKMRKNRSATGSAILNLKSICPRRISKTPKPLLISTFSDIM